MNGIFRKPAAVVIALIFATALGVLPALVQVVQIALDVLPPDSQRLGAAPVWHFMHVLGGATFGILGPIQFGRVLQRKYGFWHRLLGRTFVAAGMAISLSSLGLLMHFPDTYSASVSVARLVFGLALGVSLAIAMLAILKQDFVRHRNWMIRAYAIGIGTTVIAIVFLPVYLITGAPPQGPAADIAFVGCWTACIAFAEVLVRRI